MSLMAEATGSAGGGHHRSRDWTALPRELLASIRGCLPPVDFARFPAVCRAWRRPGPSTPAPQLPWLMLPPPPRRRRRALWSLPPSPSSSSSSPVEVPTYRFFSPSEGRTYVVPVPGLLGARCVGSYEGWVASFDGATVKIFLVNPLTRARIPLPPLSATHDASATRDEEGRIVEYTISVDDGRGTPVSYMTGGVQWLVGKVVMSSKPTDTACKLAAILVNFLPPVSISVGGEKWKALGRAEHLVDIVYDGRDGKYCGLNYDNRVFRWGTGADDAVGVECWPPAPGFPEESYQDERHLVVHRPSGDLLLAFVHYNVMPKLRDAIEGTAFEVEAVKVFRHSGGAWRRLDSLGGCSLFLGSGGCQAICLSAKDIPELRADCIFLIGREINDSFGFKEAFSTYGLWVYDLKEGILEPYRPDWRSTYQEPFWFTPNLS